MRLHPRRARGDGRDRRWCGWLEAKPQVLTYALEMAWRLAQAKPAKKKSA